MEFLKFILWMFAAISRNAIDFYIDPVPCNLDELIYYFY